MFKFRSNSQLQHLLLVLCISVHKKFFSLLLTIFLFAIIFLPFAIITFFGFVFCLVLIVLQITITEDLADMAILHIFTVPVFLYSIL